MRPPFLFSIFANISSLAGIGEKYSRLLANLVNGDKIIDIIWHLPSSIVFRNFVPNLNSIKLEQINTLKVKVVEHIAPKNKKLPYQVICEDVNSKQIKLIFFKIYQDSINKNLPIGASKIISGKIQNFNNILQMSHPEYIVDPTETSKILEIEPIYPLTAGISNKFMTKVKNQALKLLPPLDEWIDIHFQKSLNLPSFNQAIYMAHNPKNIDELSPLCPAKTRLAYDELLANQLALAIVREKIKQQSGRKIIGNGLLRKKLLDMLEFNLTNAQEKVLAEIYEDQASNNRMLRLLQGDVGSGKTIVALFTMLNAIETGAQATIMAPTEILAKQHFETICPICEELKIKVAILTGKVKGKARANLLNDLLEGKIDILIGTHALFVEDVKFCDLACVIIDEQHRFGVHQRLNLSNKGNNADVLVMTATPIPRSLIFTLFGDMDYSKIDQLPEGRKPVDTRVMPINKAEDVIEGIKRKILLGERVYWVCPLVEESEKLDLAAAQKRFELLQKTFGNDVGLIHGKMKEKEKDLVMELFRQNKIKILVATTVIEVGVNVPEATIMVIEHAQRFGLAQLHQLRGRVKRGIKPASCVLLYGFPLSETARARLNIMRDSEDGFVIAEKDLELRGGGEILGTKQSGFAQFRLADMSKHQNLFASANKDAKMIMQLDPELKSARGQALRNLLYLFERDDAIKTYLSG